MSSRKMAEDLNLLNAKDLIITEKPSVNVLNKSLFQIETNVFVNKFIKRSAF